MGCNSFPDCHSNYRVGIYLFFTIRSSKMKKPVWIIFLVLILPVTFSPFVVAQGVDHIRPNIWIADNRNGTYKNPVIYADYSDPDAIRVGNDFYMTASSFNSWRGLAILHSKERV